MVEMRLIGIDMRRWRMRLMLLAGRFSIPFVIGERIILGTGDRLLLIVGEYLEMFMIRGIWQMQDALGKRLQNRREAHV